MDGHTDDSNGESIVMTSDDSKYYAMYMEVVILYDESTKIDDFEEESMVTNDSKNECNRKF